MDFKNQRCLRRILNNLKRTDTYISPLLEKAVFRYDKKNTGEQVNNDDEEFPVVPKPYCRKPKDMKQYHRNHHSKSKVPRSYKRSRRKVRTER